MAEKWRIYSAQLGGCFYCAQPFPLEQLTRDHVTPQSRGGKNEGNIVLACRSCNETKDNRVPMQSELDRLHDMYCRIFRQLSEEAELVPGIKVKTEPEKRRGLGDLRARQQHHSQVVCLIDCDAVRLLSSGRYESPIRLVAGDVFGPATVTSSCLHPGHLIVMPQPYRPDHSFRIAQHFVEVAPYVYQP